MTEIRRMSTLIRKDFRVSTRLVLWTQYAEFAASQRL